jgi:hypothetical protein
LPEHHERRNARDEKQDVIEIDHDGMKRALSGDLQIKSETECEW